MSMILKGVRPLQERMELLHNEDFKEALADLLNRYNIDGAMEMSDIKLADTIVSSLRFSLMLGELYDEQQRN